jgi:hypothetical protein
VDTIKLFAKDGQGPGGKLASEWNCRQFARLRSGPARLAFELFLNLSIWGRMWKWNKMIQSFNSQLSGVISAAAAPTPKKQQKKWCEFPSRFTRVSNNEPGHGKTVTPT